MAGSGEARAMEQVVLHRFRDTAMLAARRWLDLDLETRAGRRARCAAE